MSELLPRSDLAFVAMIIIMAFGRWRLSWTRYAGRPEENLAEEIWDDFVCLEEEKPAFVRVDEVSSIEEVTGRLVHLMADEVDPVLFLGL